MCVLALAGPANVADRIFGRGPLKRRVVVKPKGEGAGPVPAVVADVVARNGALHVLPKLLKPPFPHHGKHGEHGHHDAFAGLF